jgi:hypothetical protein
MSTNANAENARAAAEAVEAVVKRQSSGNQRVMESALMRYLAAEAFHERRREVEATNED